MPYIIPEQRARVDAELYEISKHVDTSGELNYCITMLLHRYILRHGLNYTNLNDCIGAVDAAGKEFYRRVVVPYENKKIEENGDIVILEGV